MGRKKIHYKFSIPTSWDDITLLQFQDICRMYNGAKPTMLDFISYFTQKPKDELEQYPTPIIMELTKQLSYLDKDITKVSPNNEVDIDGDIYRINKEEVMKFKEFVDSQTVMQNDSRNYAMLLAILCRKEGEIYDDDFISMKLNERVRMFENTKINKVTPLISFFLSSLLISRMDMEQFSNNLKEQVTRLLDNIESSARNGDGRKRFSKSQMKRLQTLKKRLSSI